MGLKPIFCLFEARFVEVEFMRQHAALEKLISPIVANLGLTWVGLQYFPQGKRSILRLFVDKPGGVSVEDWDGLAGKLMPC